jgi:hypothetical protein
MYFQRSLEEIRRHPRRWLWGLLVIALEKLLEHRALAWANDRVDDGAVLLLPEIRDTLMAAIHHPVISVLLMAAAYAVGMVFFAHYTAWRKNRNRSSSTGLNFAGCDGSTSRNIPRWAEGVVTVIEVTNSSSRVPITAKDVIAQIQFSHVSGSQRLTVPNAAWYAMTDSGSTHSAGWRSSVDLEASETQCFVLFVHKDQENRLWVHRDNGSPVGVLEYGGWEVILRVTAENVAGFEGTLKFTITKFGGFQFETSPAFALRRRLPPRFPQG